RPRSQSASRSDGASGSMRSGRCGQARLLGLGHVKVAFPAFVLELDVLDGDSGIAVGVEVRQGLKLRYPAAKDFVGEGELAGFVVDLDDYVFAEILQGDFRAQSRSEIPHLVRPLLELDIVGHAALKRDRLELRSAWRLSGRGRVAALAMLHQLGAA